MPAASSAGTAPSQGARLRRGCGCRGWSSRRLQFGLYSQEAGEEIVLVVPRIDP